MTDRDLQLQAIDQWMAAIHWNAAKPDSGDEVTPETLRARMTFCEVLRIALRDLIEAQAGDEDALLYGLISMGQMIGVRSALDNSTNEDAVQICIRAGNFMIAACMETKRMLEQQEMDRQDAVLRGAIH